MLIEKDIHKILSQLVGQEFTQISYDGSEILIRFVEDASKLSLTTDVYSGGNYIPSSVRRCLSMKSPVASSSISIKTFLTVDEKNYLIKLHYVSELGTYSSKENFKELIEEFGLIAQKWRDHLDENDKNDLIYVRHPR